MASKKFKQLLSIYQLLLRTPASLVSHQWRIHLQNCFNFNFIKKDVFIRYFLLGIIFILPFGKLQKVFSQSFGGTTAGATTFCSTSNSGVVTLSGNVGTILNWQSSTDGGFIWNNITNTTSNQTYFNLNQTTCYRAVVQDGINPSDISSVVCISVYPESIGGTILGGGAFCDTSGSGTFTLSGYSGNILYWQSSTNGGTSWTTISNTTDTQNYTNTNQNMLFWAIVQSNTACPKDTSNQANVTIDAITLVGTIMGDSNVCSGNNSGVINLSGHTGTILSWESSIDSSASWVPISNITATQSYLNLVQATWYHAIVKSGSCWTDTTLNFIVNVSAASLGGIISGEGNFCGTPASDTLKLNGYTGTILNWASSIDNGVTWLPISNTDTTENYINLQNTTWYMALVKNGSCPADTSNIVIINVAPQTVAGNISSSATACIGLNSDTLLLTGNIGNILGWISSTNNGINWSPIANTTTSLIYNNLIQSTSYSVIIQSGLCNIDTSASVLITVVPMPIAIAGNDLSIPQGNPLILNGSGSGTPAWSPTVNLDNPAIFSPTANPDSTIAYVLTVTDINGCINSDTVIITVVFSEFNGLVSNYFSPNGDGINDNWYVEGIQNFPDNEVFIYNIYGNEVFKAKPYSNDWQGLYNGKELTDGTYYYLIKFENKSKILKGTIDLLRSK